MTKTRYVVKDEHTLGYINEDQPELMGLLRCSVLRGSPHDPMSGYIPATGNLRDATLADFEAYGVMAPPDMRKGIFG